MTVVQVSTPNKQKNNWRFSIVFGYAVSMAKLIQTFFRKGLQEQKVFVYLRPEFLRRLWFKIKIK